MSITCLSIVSDSVEPTQLNQLFNSPNKNIGQLTSGVILETIALQNFGISNNEYCADPVCLSNVTSTSEICAVILHECETGRMIDYQFDPAGVVCDENNKIWITLTCWKLPQDCEPETNKIDQYMALDADPCKAVQFIRASILEAVTSQKVVSWSFAGKSVTLRNQKPDELYKLLCHYEALCRQQKYEQTGCPQPTRFFRFIPDC